MEEEKRREEEEQREGPIFFTLSWLSAPWFALLKVSGLHIALQQEMHYTLSIYRSCQSAHNILISGSEPFLVGIPLEVHPETAYCLPGESEI